ncbi:hypothetical protein QCA50_016600 [Cerrena zonata]|uniref:DUF6534 domain-containing protein n=1 Tax=Cerrena zonata TaxID=2478898 RepID=A0AAW0FMX2_9APHY
MLRFYVHRMWTFSRNPALIIATSVLLIGHIGLYINCAINGFEHGTWQRLEGPGYNRSVLFTVALSIAIDSIIASTMIYYLYRRHSSLKTMQGIVNWLILYFVNTGVVLVALSVTTLIFYLKAPGDMVYAGLILIYARFLANALFGSLNARQHLRTKRHELVTFGGVSMNHETAL